MHNEHYRCYDRHAGWSRIIKEGMILFSSGVPSSIRKIFLEVTLGVCLDMSFSRQVMAVGIKIIPDRAARVLTMKCTTT